MTPQVVLDLLEERPAQRQMIRLMLNHSRRQSSCEDHFGCPNSGGEAATSIKQDDTGNKTSGLTPLMLEMNKHLANTKLGGR